VQTRGRTAIAHPQIQSRGQMRTPAHAQNPLTMSHRELYIDRLRTAMTALVLFTHAAMTYGGMGSWFYREIPPSHSLSSVFFTLFCVNNQAYLMGLFFLLAGYFTPASLARKGYRRFVLDRCLRLGIPLAVFGMFVGPLTVVMVEISTTSEARSVWPTLLEVWQHDGFINGPLWFVQALLIFNLGYCAWCAITSHDRIGFLQKAAQTPTPVPPWRKWFFSVIAVGAAAFLLRLPFPVSDRILGLWLGFYASYIFLFAIGITAWRNNWFAQLAWRDVRPWVIITILAWPMLPAARLLVRGPGSDELFGGGLNLPAALFAFWEPLVAWGIIAGLLLFFRAHLNIASPVWDWFGRRAYAVYVLHTPVLVALALLISKWHASPMSKFMAVGTLGCMATWVAADALLRLPGVQRIL